MLVKLSAHKTKEVEVCPSLDSNDDKSDNSADVRGRRAIELDKQCQTILVSGTKGASRGFGRTRRPPTRADVIARVGELLETRQPPRTATA